MRPDYKVNKKTRIEALLSQTVLEVRAKLELLADLSPTVTPDSASSSSDEKAERSGVPVEGFYFRQWLNQLQIDSRESCVQKGFFF